jgi:hypothetical protein
MAASLTAPKILSVPGNAQGNQSRPVKVARITMGSAATNDVQVDAQATYQLLSIPAGTLVLSVRARVITAFSTSVTITLGDTNAAAGYLSSAKIAPTSADAVGIPTASHVGTEDAYSGGRKYLAADFLKAVIGGATPAAGKLEIFVEYIEGSNGTT